MLSLAADTPGLEDASEHRCSPVTACNSRDAAAVQIGAECTQAVTGEKASGALAYHGGFLLAHGFSIGLKPERACSAATDTAGLRELLGLAANPAALVVALF